jgi:acyl-CoA synthetase (AMP-forming)/AMP-acid ligase II
LPAIAGGVAAAAYLDGKYQLRKDVASILGQKAAESNIIEMVKKDRVDLWYNFEDTVNKMPKNDQAIWSRSGCYTWRETYDQACRYGAFLQSHGVRPRDLVATILTNEPEIAFQWLGCWSIGCAPALLNHHLVGEALIHCLKVSGANLVLVDGDPDVRQRIEDVRSEVESLGLRIIILDEATKATINALPARRPGDELRRGMKPEYPMCLLYTSGSTGHPKAVSFGMGRGSMLGGSRIKNIGIKPGPNGDRYYICMPLYHGTGGVAMVSSFMAGVTVCIGKKFSTSRFWDEIRDSNATAFVYVGETARYLLAASPSPRDKDHNVRVVFGNGMRPEVWRRFRERFDIDTITEFFNSTEGVFSLLNISRGPFTDACVGQHGGLLRFLLRNFYVAAEIDHETGDLYRDPVTGLGRQRTLEEGGEMLVGVPGEEAFAGYWKNKAATDKKFARDLFKKGDLWYRSGDALRRDKDGRWFFMDRYISCKSTAISRN